MSEILWQYLLCRLWVATSRHLIRCNSVREISSDGLSKAEPNVGNHTGYKQWRGTKTTAEQISDLYTGLKQSYLTDFDVMLTGYAPSAEAVHAIGSIARDLKLKASTKAGSFFWGDLLFSTRR